MLVAEKGQYTDTYYEPTLDIEEPYIKPKSRVEAKAEAKPKSRILPLVLVLVCFFVCGLTVARYAEISQNQQEIADLEKTLEEVQGIQEQLNLELVSRGTLDRIEEYAKENLDMNYPEKDQVLAVKLPEVETRELVDGEANFSEKESLWDKIVGLLD